ncbi:hypothetical protein P691DRAFT_104996 [Macrolepiota fuliginosa MF-IS2]|uniref:Nephrocystin 3-like N-terminal domain-containing protein n=1 Tax=Macrolepiota fuliginosa MF-IS2 TaxID=1400762 RepID=A0A9P6C0Q4_9AGAR|nr:hypothetical protein P691DRAFT_104996 [Macrolepiota fuliginosa MF-IS2]
MLSNTSNLVLNNCLLVEHDVAEGSGESSYASCCHEKDIDDREGLRILYNNSDPRAAYDSAARELDLGSIPKTDHEDFVAEFVAWTHQTDSPVLRLNGPRSNLAQLCAEKVQEELAASFFYPQSQRADDPSQIFITIADQLATHIPSYANILDAKLRRYPALVTKSLKVQFRELIFAPIEELLAKGDDLGSRKVIIVEAIDECVNVHARCEILAAILEFSCALPFRWAIFGQPDSQVEALLKGRSLTMVSCWNVCHSAPNFLDGEGESLRMELIYHEGWIAVRWMLVTCGSRIVTCTAFFFFQPEQS